jgi:hypothetical protein
MKYENLRERRVVRATPRSVVEPLERFRHSSRRNGSAGTGCVDLWSCVAEKTHRFRLF